ncbi:MAG: biopolymer transporter ExbD [Planctomycetota bacterium]|nr:biopolymer transporter ExbD [Planctomycetota bacterium]
MASIFKRGPARPQANITSMIDVVFLLIVFFVLVSQIVDLESVDMELPEPEHPAAALPEEEPRAVLNVLPGDDGDCDGYRLAGVDYPPTPDGLGALRTALVAIYQQTPGIRVNLRADRATDYRWVSPVLQLVRQAAGLSGTGQDAARMNLVVQRGGDPS